MENVSGVASRSGCSPGICEDCVSLSATIEGLNTCVSCNFCFAAAERKDELVINGHLGQISCSIFGSEPLLLRDINGDTTKFDLPKPDHVQQPLIQLVVKDIINLPQHFRYFSMFHPNSIVPAGDFVVDGISFILPFSLRFSLPLAPYCLYSAVRTIILL